MHFSQFFSSGANKSKACLVAVKELGSDISRAEQDVLLSKTTREIESFEDFLQNVLLVEIRKHRKEEDAVRILDQCRESIK